MCPHRVAFRRQREGQVKRGRVVIGDHPTDDLPISLSNNFVDNAAQERALLFDGGVDKGFDDGLRSGVNFRLGAMRHGLDRDPQLVELDLDLCALDLLV